MNRKFSFNKSMLFAGLLSAMTLGATSQVYAVQSPDVQKMQQQTVKLTGNVSDAMGAKAIRVTKMEEVEPALKAALSSDGPVVLDCWIDQDLSVYPMVPAGASLDEVFDEEDVKK